METSCKKYSKAGLDKPQVHGCHGEQYFVLAPGLDPECATFPAHPPLFIPGFLCPSADQHSGCHQVVGREESALLTFLLLTRKGRVTSLPGPR